MTPISDRAMWQARTLNTVHHDNEHRWCILSAERISAVEVSHGIDAIPVTFLPSLPLARRMKVNRC